MPKKTKKRKPGLRPANTPRRPLTASEFLTTPEPPAQRMSRLIGWPPTLRWPPDADELVTPAATYALQTFLWPLTVDDLVTLRPVEAIKKAEEERRKPTDDKLMAWLTTRMIVAIKESHAMPDPDTRRRHLHEAFEEGLRDVQAAYATAYTGKQRTNLENLAAAGTAKEERTKRLTARVQADVKKAWRDLPDPRQKSVHNITKILCNPRRTKNRALTPNMERWKYRWSYQNHEEAIPFWTLHAYVDKAVNALNAPSA